MGRPVGSKNKNLANKNAPPKKKAPRLPLKTFKQVEAELLESGEESDNCDSEVNTDAVAGADTDADDAGKRSRSDNYHPDEDVIICKAYCSATSDGKAGANQRGALYWAEMFRRYEGFRDEKGASIHVKTTERNQPAIRIRTLMESKGNVGALNIAVAVEF